MLRAMRTLAITGAILAGLGVVAGAFGAHALERRIAPELLGPFEVGARYHLLHALAVLVAVALAPRSHPTLVRAAGWAFVAGVVVFGGSLYALALTGVRGFGAITPVGGLAFLTGWTLLALALARGRSGPGA
jgi:uncharacterized membrane protein YgdD (TMEM256/DUF423 family)